MENSCVGGDIKSTLNGGNVLLKYIYSLVPMFKYKTNDQLYRSSSVSLLL